MKTNQYPQFTKFQISLIITNPDLQESPQQKTKRMLVGMRIGIVGVGRGAEEGGDTER